MSQNPKTMIVGKPLRVTVKTKASIFNMRKIGKCRGIVGWKLMTWDIIMDGYFKKKEHHDSTN